MNPLALLRWWWNGGVFRRLLLACVPLAVIVAVVTSQVGDDSEPVEPISPVLTITEDAAPLPPLATSTTQPSLEASPTEAIAPTPATAPTETPVPEVRSYAVQPGDGISAICQREVPSMVPAVCVSEIVSLNGLANADQLSVGQVLILPEGAVPASDLAPTPVLVVPTAAPVIPTETPLLPPPTLESTAAPTVPPIR